MNVKFLGRRDHLAKLAELHRAAEEGDAIPDIDSDLRAAFEVDQQLIETLGGLASRSVPASPAIGRSRLLAAVAARNDQSPDNKGVTMIEKLLTGRGLALIAAAGIFVGGAATVGASGGVSGAADHFTSMLQAAHLTSGDATSTPAGGAALSLVSTSTPEATDTAESADHAAPHGCTPTAVATGTPAATNTPAPTTTASAEDSNHGNGPRNGDCDVRGIPTTNPNFKPEANGTCEKGESAVKTTPSGIMVNVPCQALDHGDENGGGTPTPEATEHGNEGGNSGEHRPTTVPN
jgi:hypothetical protein